MFHCPPLFVVIITLKVQFNLSLPTSLSFIFHNALFMYRCPPLCDYNFNNVLLCLSAHPSVLFTLTMHFHVMQPTSMQGWAQRSFPFWTFRSFKEDNILFRSFSEFLAPYETQKDDPFFSKERKRAQWTQRSFLKNGKEHKECNILLQRT